MNINLFNWFEQHHNYAYSFLRIFVGGALFMRGLLFISDPHKLTQLAGSEQFFWMYSYIAIVHLVGGLLLVIGLFTRLAALIQIPILLGAVFFVHLSKGFLASGQSLELSVLVLFLLIVFFLFGSGDWSFDMKRNKK
ncbi:MAG: DoxX family protein [Ignavibacterium album]|uniref:DoxX family protein n=1 Tax=Ignavibacterium album TaxID=591197 RepID=A0A7V2ZL23_9BACT|nr:DoxX family protein [Ignavibacterium album]MCX8106411.1 DoxX family protein [Ignavibacterium album]